MISLSIELCREVIRQWTENMSENCATPNGYCENELTYFSIAESSQSCSRPPHKACTNRWLSRGKRKKPRKSIKMENSERSWFRCMPSAQFSSCANTRAARQSNFLDGWIFRGKPKRGSVTQAGALGLDFCNQWALLFRTSQNHFLVLNSQPSRLSESRPDPLKLMSLRVWNENLRNHSL